MNKVYVVAAHEHHGKLQGALSSVPATALGSAAIRGALTQGNVDNFLVDEVFMGHPSSECWASTCSTSCHGRRHGTERAVHHRQQGLRQRAEAIALASRAIALGDADVVVAGGMENMSSVPRAWRTVWREVRSHQARGRHGQRRADRRLQQDAHGQLRQLCAKENGITREEQDAFAIESYRRASEAWESGKFTSEVVPVEVPQRRGEPVVVDCDEEFTNIRLDKIPQLRPAFDKEGTVTAANASTLNDGASALVLASEDAVAKHGLTPVAEILACADAAQAPEWFTTAPSLALPKALSKAGLESGDIDLWELNEAFAVVGIANNRRWAWILNASTCTEVPWRWAIHSVRVDPESW